MEAVSGNITAVLEKDVTKLTHYDREFLSVVFSLIFLGAIIGNVVSIRLSIKRRSRLFHKCCVISLAISDLLLVISTCAYSLSMFSHPWAIWVAYPLFTSHVLGAAFSSSMKDLGKPLCKLIPFTQTMAVLVNSFTLSAIAMDRYNAIVHATRKQWNPNLRATLFIMSLTWFFANALSVPMLIEYNIKSMDVIRYDDIHHEVTSRVKADFCAFRSPDTMSLYFSLLFSMIFLPIMLTFLALYGIIGWHFLNKWPVWKPSSWRRSNVLAMGMKATAEGSGDTPSQAQSESTTVGPGASAPPLPIPTRPADLPQVPCLPGMTACDLSGGTEDFPQNWKRHRRPPPMETIPENEEWNGVPREPLCPAPPTSAPPPLPPRGIGVMHRNKRRILKIIFALMVTFMLTRLPIWVLNVTSIEKEQSNRNMWLLQYAFSALSLLGTVLNPYLYSYIQERHAASQSSSSCNLTDPIRKCFGCQKNVENDAPRAGTGRVGRW